MADKWQAIDEFWNSFGWAAFDESDVPDGTAFPYITYNVSVSSFEEPIILTASLWDRSTKWSVISKKADLIGKALEGYKIIKIDDGYIYMNKGTPFAQRMSDEDDSIRRIVINIEAEFFTN